MRRVFNAGFNFIRLSLKQLLPHNDFDLHWNKLVSLVQNLINKGCNCVRISFALAKNYFVYSGKKLGLERKSFLVIQSKKKEISTLVALNMNPFAIL